MSTKITRQQYFDSHRSLSRIAVAVVSLSLAFFQLYTALFGSFDALLQRAIHLGLGLMLVFLIYPSPRTKKTGWLDTLLFLGSVAITAYLVFFYNWISFERFSTVTPLTFLEKILAPLSILLVLEGTRRVAGLGMLCVVLGFFVYFFIAPYLPGFLQTIPLSLNDLLDFQYLGTLGIYGTPLGVSATEIALFIIFGSVYMGCGGAELINNIGASITGKTRGGPAKLAVVATAAMGTVSGSGTANVAVTGPITIPMMIKAGYRPAFAGAVEAVSATGGQIMPPVMGAAAFIMSAFTGIPYITICRYAVLPAILYYWGLFVAVHLEAVKRNLPLMDVRETSTKKIMRSHGHLLVPVVILFFLLFIGFTPRMAAGSAVLTTLLLSPARHATRVSIWDLLEAFEHGAKGLLIVIMATAAAGMIVGVVEYSGLGQRIGAGLVYIGGGHTLLVLFLGMILAMLLGMGMPTSAAYIIMASTAIPAFIAVGLPTHVAHMFGFYFACLSLITPPVAITAYAASAIAQSSLWETGWLAFRLGLPCYIVPYMFVYGQSLLLIGPFFEILTTAITALIGVSFLAVCSEGFLFRPLNRLERLIAFITALLFIAPSYILIIPAAILGGYLVLTGLYKLRGGKTELIGTGEVTDK